MTYGQGEYIIYDMPSARLYHFGQEGLQCPELREYVHTKGPTITKKMRKSLKYTRSDRILLVNIFRG